MRQIQQKEQPSIEIIKAVIAVVFANGDVIPPGCPTINATPGKNKDN